MGSKVKAAIGIGLAIFSGGISTFLLGATAGTVAFAGITYGMIASVAITLVGASLAGSALSQDVADTFGTESYAGVKLQTQKSNVNPVPIVYGENRLGSNIIYQESNEAINGVDNKDFWSIQVISEAEVNDYMVLYANSDTMVDKGSDVHTLVYTHVKAYADSGATGMALSGVSFAKDQAGATQTGTQLGLTNFTIPPNLAFLAVHQQFDSTDNNHVSLDNINAKIQGKKIRTIVSGAISTEAYSNNPAEIILDLLTGALSIPDTDIDLVSFQQSKTDCNTNGWTCNIALVQQANIQSIISDILATCRGQIVHSNSVWKLKIDTKSQPLAQALTDDDIISNSLNISMKGNREIANKIILKYVNPADEWLSAQVVKEDTDLQALDSQTLEKTLDIKGITNATQAGELAEITLNSMRYTEDASGNRIKQTPLVLSFATTVKNAHLEVGDVISIDHDVLDRVRKFVILSAETDQSGLIQIITREYAETHYKDSSGTYLI